MYPTTGAYKTAITQNIRNVRITGSITLKDSTVINISDEDIVQGSLYVSEQAVSGEDIEVGNVYASEMGLSLSIPLANPYSLDGARILLHFGIDVSNDGSGLWETVPLGYFYVTEIERKARYVKLTALDGMLLFDVPCGEPGPSTPRNLVVYACTVAGVTLGTSIAEIDTLANATTLLATPDVTKIKTCRDLLMWACQLMGAFARMDRSGQLEIVPIAARASAKAITKGERFSSDVSDFAVKVTKVSMQVGEQEYSRGTEGMTMLLEENPLILGMDETQINAVLDNLLAQVTRAIYVPVNVNFIGDPAIQAGDYVTIRDAGILDKEIDTYFLSESMPFVIETSIVASIVTHSTWHYRGSHNIKGVGKHGLVRGVQNQQIKAVSSIVAIARAAQDLALSANQSTQLIKDAIGGHVLIRQSPDETNEILIMDHPDPTQAVKIWRWNMGGLGYSDNCVGADNPAREYDIAMTMDGAINANFIKTGQLDAGVVRIGPESYFAPGYDPVDNHVYFQYSVNGTTGWHDTFNSTLDKYMRQKVGDNGTWSEPARIVGIDGAQGPPGEDGQDVRKFTSQPTPPYGIGDLWIKSNGDTMVCIVARATGSYTASDWRDVAQNKFNAPGYVVSTNEGIKVYDPENALRVLLGSWLRDAIRKYGIQIFDGEIYSSYFQTGDPDESSNIIKIGRSLLTKEGYIEFLGSSGTKILDLRSGSDQGQLSLYDDGLRRAFVCISSGSTRELWAHTLETSGMYLSVATGEHITLGATGTVTGRRGVGISRIRDNLLPLNAHGGTVGNNDYPWSLVRAHYVQQGDSCFDERECAICGMPFESGDILCLLVKTVDDTFGTMTIPVHERCKHTPAAFDTVVLETETRYRLNNAGEIETYQDIAYEETEEEIMTLHPDYEFDEASGGFRRKVTEDNISLFGIEALEKGIPTSKRCALVTDTVIRKKPKVRKIRVQIGELPE